MRVLVLAIALLLGWLGPARADGFDTTAFGQIPVLENGRVKPMERFATIQLHRISGADTFEGKPALLWLAATIFNPADAANQKLFAVEHQSVRAALGLTETSRYRRFSLAELAAGLGKTADQVEALMQRKRDELSADEQELMDLHSQVLIFNQMLQSLSLILPLPVPVPADVLPDSPHQTFLDVLRVEPELVQKVRGFLTSENTANPDLLNDEQEHLAEFVYALSKLRSGGSHNQLLRIIPSVWSDSKGEWFSPWQTILDGHSAPQTAALLSTWKDMATAYRTGDAEAWRIASTKALQQAHDLIADPAQVQRLRLEVFYDAVKPYQLAGLFYGLTIVLALAALKTIKYAAPAMKLSMGMAVILHAAAIGLRIAILNRPPVGTLYESLLFVGLVMALCSLFITLRSGKPALALAGAAGSGLLLAIAPIFQTDGESLTMLSAVLNTNFWLTTHVLCITAGYGFCLVTALLAHGLLAFAPRAGDNPHGKALLYRLSIISLLLTTIGTLLGGVWADQSWGRFWGWDPKENGAMLIALWLIWLQHGRITAQLSHQAWLAGCAFLTVVVALAWFGVNLLGIGLHSYGFTSGIAAGLISFCLAEMLLIATLWHRSLRHAA